MQIIIPQQDIAVLEKKKSDGTPFKVTAFMAQGMDGKFIPSCEAWGDKKAMLDEAMKSGKPIEAESVEFDAKWNRNNVKFPFQKGAGGGSWQGLAKRPFVPNGYKGQPVSLDQWLSLTRDVLAQMVGAIKAQPLKLADDVVAEQARSLVAQYWMAVKDNATFPPGCEPKAEAAVTAQPTGPAPAQAQTAATVGDEDNLVVAFYSDQIANTHTVPGLDSLMAEIRGDKHLTAEHKAELQTRAFAHKRELSKAA